jgi:uroporphyrinogen-III synthase
LPDHARPAAPTRAEGGGVLVTRPLPAALATAALLTSRGYTPVIAPLLTILPCPADLPPPGALQAILVGSGNAVDHLPATHRQLRLLAVGNATAARARRAGHGAVASAAADAARLAALAGATLDPAGKPLLLAVGEGQGAALEAALTAQGFRVLRRAVYTTAAAASLPAAARAALTAPAESLSRPSSEGPTVRAGLFFSAETARVFRRLVEAEGVADRLEALVALAISAATAAELRPLPWREVREAHHPDQEALLALLP